MANDGGVWVRVYGGDAGGGVPGAAVIGGATADDPLFPVNTSSFTGDGTNGDLNQAYDVYEFLGSGTLNVTTPGFADALIIGGGGSGGHGDGGGGGAGGHFAISDAYLSNGALTVTVGAGGAGVTFSGTTGGSSGNNGVPSHLADYLSPGGGAGNCYAYNNAGLFVTRLGLGGGSGGGASGGSGSAAGGAGINGIGNNGGSTNGTGPYGNHGGGGGGASTAGSSASGGGPNDGGHGGDGATSSITGSPVIRAGGGAAFGNADGGSGGGGDSSVSGAVNTGSGGGGEYQESVKISGSGGSGIVIVRVKVASESYPFRTKTTAPKTAHAARIEDGIVRQVIVIPHLDDDDAKITEYCNRIGLAGTWVDTSYLGSRRGKYAGVGDTFTMTKSGGEFVSPVVEEIE